MCAHQCMYAHAFVLIIRLHWPLRWHHSLWIVNTKQIKILSKNLPRKLVLREREACTFQHHCLFPPSASNRTLATPSISAFHSDPISSVVQGQEQVKYKLILFICQRIFVCVFKHLWWFTKYDTRAHFPVLGSEFDETNATIMIIMLLTKNSAADTR